MPLSVEALNPDSSTQQVRDAISESIEACMKEGGKTQKECAGQVYGMARQATGKELGEGAQR